MKNFVQQGRTLSFVAVAAVLGGAGLLLGDDGLFGVNAFDVEEGDEGEATIEGVFDLPKAAVAVEAFEKAFFDPAAGLVTNVEADNVAIGVFALAAGSGVTSVNVRLIPQTTPIVAGGGGG